MHYSLTFVRGATSSPGLAVPLMFARHAFHLTGGVRRRCTIQSFLFLTGRVPRFIHLRVLLGRIFQRVGLPVKHFFVTHVIKKRGILLTWTSILSISTVTCKQNQSQGQGKLNYSTGTLIWYGAPPWVSLDKKKVPSANL